MSLVFVHALFWANGRREKANQVVVLLCACVCVCVSLRANCAEFETRSWCVRPPIVRAAILMVRAPKPSARPSLTDGQTDALVWLELH